MCALSRCFCFCCLPRLQRDQQLARRRIPPWFHSDERSVYILFLHGSRPHEISVGVKFACERCNAAVVQLRCPSCERSLVWAGANYHEGHLIDCPTCHSLFQSVACPGCHEPRIWRQSNGEAYQPGSSLLTCGKCSLSFHQLSCPRCATTNIWFAHVAFRKSNECDQK